MVFSVHWPVKVTGKENPISRPVRHGQWLVRNSLQARLRHVRLCRLIPPGWVNVCNRVYCVCSGPWPFNLFLPVLFLFDWVGVLWPQLSKSVKTCALGPPRPLSASVPAVAGRQLVIVRAAAYASDSGESLHCFLVGVIKSYVIATSDLWLFIHASNLLPSLPTPLPYS